MEIEGQDGSKILLKRGLSRKLGRRLGFDSDDPTISRHHLSLQLCEDDNQTVPNSNARVHFEVTGKNPVWVWKRTSGEIRVFRRFEVGEMEGGDMFCVSSRKPVWFTLKRIELEGEDESEVKRELGSEIDLAKSLQSSCGVEGVEDLELDSVNIADIDHIDPVKEFGFLAIGHEFDNYPKQMIRDLRNWDWFLEENKEDSEDDELLERKRKKHVKRKGRKAEGNCDDDDDDWTGESEDDKMCITKLRRMERPACSTRSKDCSKPINDVRASKHFVQKKTICGKEEDEGDDTLGGFIVNDDDLEEEEEMSEEEEAEEDYDEEDD